MINVSLIVLAGLVAARLLRSQSAAFRHWVLWSAVACAAAAPAVQMIAPRWDFGQTPAPIPAGRQSAPAAVTVSEMIPQPPTAPQGGPAAASPRFSRSAAAGALSSIWMAGTGLSVLILLVGFGRLAWLASRAEPLRHGAWRDLADEIGRQYGLRRRVVLLQSEHPTLLVTWGWLRPKIILPAGARDWPPDRMRIVLCHELAHIRRADWVAQMTAELLRAVYWFNPLMWIASRRLRRESEQASDDDVLSLGVAGPEYAAHLLDLARAFRNHRRSVLPDLPAPAMLRPSSLERRVSAMLNTRLNRRPAGGRIRAAALTGLLGFTILITGFGTAAQTFSTLTGTVVDPMNSLIPGVTLTLANTRTQAKHEVTSDQNGRFEFVGLPAGEYVLEARLPGFKMLKADVPIAGQDVQRNLALQVGSLTETIMVSVSASAPPEAPGPARDALPKRNQARCTAAPTGGNIVPPTKLKDVKPIYPRHMSGANAVAGKVVLDTRIAPDGSVADVRVVGEAHPDLAQSAIDAVRQWEFDSTLLNCVPIEAPMRVTVSFAVEK